MKNPDEMDTCSVICIPSFLKTGAGVQAVLRL
jgi:hypothetical protein